MKEKKVWIFGDSFASPTWISDVPYIWPLRLAEKYDVKNHAKGGTGIEWSINTFFSAIQHYFRFRNWDLSDLSNIIVIFYVSEYLGRPNFHFIKNCHDQANLKFIENRRPDDFGVSHDGALCPSVEDLKKTYAEYLNFIEDYFLYIYKHDESNPLFFSQILLLKHLSGLFNKLLCVPIFSNIDAFNKNYGRIENTDKFMISKGIAMASGTSNIIMLPDQPNHLNEINHDIVYNMTVDWIENNVVFDTNKLVKND